MRASILLSAIIAISHESSTAYQWSNGGQKKEQADFPQLSLHIVLAGNGRQISPKQRVYNKRFCRQIEYTGNHNRSINIQSHNNVCQGYLKRE
jgi:hypothetical protein